MKPNFMAIHRSTSRAETAMTQKEEVKPASDLPLWQSHRYGDLVKKVISIRPTEFLSLLGGIATPTTITLKQKVM